MPDMVIVLHSIWVNVLTQISSFRFLNSRIQPSFTWSTDQVSKAATLRHLRQRITITVNSSAMCRSFLSNPKNIFYYVLDPLQNSFANNTRLLLIQIYFDTSSPVRRVFSHRRECHGFDNDGLWNMTHVIQYSIYSRSLQWCACPTFWNKTHTVLYHPSLRSIPVYHPMSGWHVTSSEQGRTRSDCFATSSCEHICALDVDAVPMRVAIELNSWRANICIPAKRIDIYVYRVSKKETKQKFNWQ